MTCRKHFVNDVESLTNLARTTTSNDLCSWPVWGPSGLSTTIAAALFLSKDADTGNRRWNFYWLASMRCYLLQVDFLSVTGIDSTAIVSLPLLGPYVYCIRAQRHRIGWKKQFVEARIWQVAALKYHVSQQACEGSYVLNQCKCCFFQQKRLKRPGGSFIIMRDCKSCDTLPATGRLVIAVDTSASLNNVTELLKGLYIYQ